MIGDDFKMAYDFVGFVPSIIPNVPKPLQDKIKFLTAIELTDEECQIFTICLEDISIVLKRDEFENNVTAVHLCFTPYGHFAFNCVGGSHASYAKLAIYNMCEIRKCGAEQVAFIFTEELVHHFWKTEDEYKTKLKVIEILQITNPHITKEYVEDWGLNWK